MRIESAGKKIDSIDVTISYRIIELFSAGLYSSPNKAFEELVCNSYDAFADKVGVYVSPDLSVDGAFIWVCDNGESMDQHGLKQLWHVGDSTKRIDATRDERRLQIGQFGIGKLATYVLANELTYVCKKNGRFLATTMDYQRIKANSGEKLTLDERELTEEQARMALGIYTRAGGRDVLPFSLFGEGSADQWTYSLLTSLKTKAAEIREGRLKWVLRTALPLNPNFQLHYNGALVESSKIDRPIKKSWKIGDADTTAEALDFAQCRRADTKHYVDFDNLKNISGRIDLYEDSLVDGTKSTSRGRSHGIFLLVRDRLINLDDPLLGMEAFSHGPFNRCRIVVHADGLDENLTSTRESIKESPPFQQLKDYLKKKFNNEVRKYYFDEELKKEQERSISHRMSQTSLTLSKRPLLVFAQKYFDGKVTDPFLIDKPSRARRKELLAELREDLSDEEPFIKKVKWEILSSAEPIAKLDLETGVLSVNLLHPYIANYGDMYKKTLPLEFIAITEVLTEAYLYEEGIDPATVSFIMRRRDNTLRELSLSDREGAPAVAQLLKDSIADSTGLEDAVYRAFLALGFEVKKLGKKGEPDGKADAILGYSSSDNCDNYSFTYEAKSTSKRKIAAGTAKLSAVRRHKTDYKADYAIEVAVDFEGAGNPESAISKEAAQQEITMMRASDLARLLLLSIPKQVGLGKIRELFDGCFTPNQVSEWVDGIQSTPAEFGPIKELVAVIYELQKDDSEAPEIASVRIRLKDKCGLELSKAGIASLIQSLQVFVPGFISKEGERVGIKARPDKVLDGINAFISNVPNEFQQMYLQAFSSAQNS